MIGEIRVDGNAPLARREVKTMGQRNENSLREKLEEAKAKRDEYDRKARLKYEEDEPLKEKELCEKAEKCEHFIEFARWQLGKKRELEL